MRHLDLPDLAALAAEVSAVEMPKVLELLDTAEIGAVLAEARPPLPPHEAAAVLVAGIVAIAPLPGGNRQLALLAALHLLAVNGLDLALDAEEAGELFARGADAAGMLDVRVTARDPLEGELRRLLTREAQQAIALALQRARLHRRHVASPADLLMGVFRAGGPGGRALGNEAGAVEVVAIPPAPPVPERRRSFDPDTRKALELAFRAATTMAHSRLTTGHLLLGLLEGGHGSQLPEGLDEGDVRRRLAQLMPPQAHTRDVVARLARVADRMRSIDPAAAAELDELRAVVAGLLGSPSLAANGDDDELLANYLADIARYPRLSRAEEMELARSARDDRRRLLIQANLGVVVSIARRYEGEGLPLLELIQEGNLGLMRALERYDPTRGYRLTTFASWWIHKAITDAIDRADR